MNHGRLPSWGLTDSKLGRFEQEITEETEFDVTRVSVISVGSCSSSFPVACSEKRKPTDDTEEWFSFLNDALKPMLSPFLDLRLSA